MSATEERSSPIRVAALILAALALLAVAFQAPIWWVSLTAPNYPAEAFPDGVRIHFHLNGVFNGCRKVEKAEIKEEEALDCVHEMDTINHYVGMYPIAAGGVVEKAFAPFLMTMLGVMALGFAIPGARARVALMGAGFAAIALWMGLAFYAPGGLHFQTLGYLEGLVTSLDQDAKSADEAKTVSPGAALIARLKAELAKAEGKPAAAPGPAAPAGSERERMIDNLKVTFEKAQERRQSGERQSWAGSGAQTLTWHYEKSLGRYFNNPAEIGPLSSTMTAAAHLVFWAILGAMGLLLWGARRTGGPLYWLLILVPMALPIFFVLEYSAWLWWYGHSLNAMGAFTVKPFMPTVFGDGKVAQFATHSYPSWGFGLMLLASALLALAALLRRKGLRAP